MKPRWKISSNYGEIYEQPSKEAALLMKKMEEVSWRQGGGWEKRELDSLKEMLSITRGKDNFDTYFVFFTEIMRKISWKLICNL